MARGEGAQETPIVRIAAEPGQRLDAGELSAHAMPPTIARRDVDDLAPQTHDAGHAPVTVRRLDIGPDAASAARALRTRRVLARGQGPSGARADRPRQAASDVQRPVPSRGAERVDARQTLVICAAPNLPCAVRDKRVVSRARLNQHLMPDLDCCSYVEIVARGPANLTRSRRFEMDTPRKAGTCSSRRIASRSRWGMSVLVRRRVREPAGGCAIIAALGASALFFAAVLNHCAEGC